MKIATIPVLILALSASISLAAEDPFVADIHENGGSTVAASPATADDTLPRSASSYFYQALGIITKERTPTPEDIILANRFHHNSQYQVLEKHGVPYLETALKVTSHFAADALDLLFTDESGVLTQPLEQKHIDLVNFFDSQDKWSALIGLGKEKVSTLIQIPSERGFTDLMALCDPRT